MKTIIVYYSMGGNTEFAALEAAEKLGAALLRIEPEKAYPDKGFKKFLWGGKSAVMAETPALRPYDFDASVWDQVILAFPVWASSPAPPLRTFLRDHAAALQGRRVAALACQAGSGAEKAFAKLEAALGKPLDATAVLIDPKDRPSADNEAKLTEFIGKCG